MHTHYMRNIAVQLAEMARAFDVMMDGAFSEGEVHLAIARTHTARVREVFADNGITRTEFEAWLKVQPDDDLMNILDEVHDRIENPFTDERPDHDVPTREEAEYAEELVRMADDRQPEPAWMSFAFVVLPPYMDED